ncbi:related to platelet-activating factor acetylhydrolase precursor [Melanopsichium pennsylvanicum]|uniref:1-alkyl-2-acetylglycerophosphocholine esterase n=2 Tax=Melanopsichium pennsylvanicum TaxID=63383 RepID=A0AAJ5C3V6_9BASI|nr:related to platelet-activating factor acetylhydrolase precursor [Melanopsichium pennsylvanicum 4]SNX82918.1 related to platelet-activating factor acetylhydrolase precursor [Melanopsichium pennsylvanicum]
MSLPRLPQNARYAVSTVTLEIPLSTLIKQDSPEPYTYQEGGETKELLTADTILVTIYYPTSHPRDAATARSPDWLEAPKLRSIGGLLKYAGIPKYLALPIILPAYSVVSQKLSATVDAPLASHDSADGFPVAVFSHGMGGTRTTYSAYCSSLAAAGMVIAAVEHRDGSSAFTTIHHPDPDGRKSSGWFGWFSGSSNGIENRIYIRPTEIDGKPDPMDVRRAQVEFRRREVLAALEILSGVNSGKAVTLVESCTRTQRHDSKILESRSKILSGFSGRLKMQDPWLIGHSFGGSTAIQALRHTSCPFGQALVLDPWVEPVPVTGADVVPVSKPLYTINSEDFTQWESHMDDVTAISRESKCSTGGKGWLLTIGAEGTEKSDSISAAAVGSVGPPNRLIIVHDMFGTLFGLDACIDALKSLFPDQLMTADEVAEIVPELIVMDWFHSTQRDFTYSSVCGRYKPIAQVFKGTLARVLLQAGVLPKNDGTAKPLMKAGSFVDDGPAEEAFENPFDPSVVETMMGSLKKLQPRPGMVDALTKIYRDRDGKGRLPPSVEKVDVWAATNGSLALGRESFLRALGEVDGADLDTDASRMGRSDVDNSIGSGIGLFSCDEIGVAKPDPKVYAEVLSRINAEPIDPDSAKPEYQGIWFVASHTWDTFAAKQAGFRTAWVTYEEFYSCPSVYGKPDVVGRNLAEVSEKILAFERNLASKHDDKRVQGWKYKKGEQMQEMIASQHTSFSDFPFLLPSMSKFIGSVNSQKILEVNVEITKRMVLEGKREESEGVLVALKGVKDAKDWRIWKEGKPRPTDLDESAIGSDGNRLGRLVVHAL